MEPPRLGPYRLGRRLAVGGMAEVFAATREGAAGFEKQVALKRILPHLTDDPELVEMFLDEARLASRLTHANVAQVFDFGEADGSYFIVMEWIRGKDLRRVMRAAADAGVAVAPAQAAVVGQAVARALSCAHGLEGDDGRPLGLVHRDVSPQNVLCSFDGEVKLTDFGIAKITTGRSRTAVGVIKGKCAYMSPEQARGEAVDGRTDLFALGIVLWELLTGQGLFTGRSDAEILRAVERFEAPPVRALRPDVPPDLEAVVARALAKDPAGRFDTAGELAGALGDVVLAHASSSEALDLGALMRRLFPEEAAGGRPGTARLPRPGAGAGPAGAGAPRGAARPPPGSLPTPPEPGDTRAEGKRATSAPDPAPASPRSQETAALEGDAAATGRPKRWRTPLAVTGVVLLAAGITWAAAHHGAASQGARAPAVTQPQPRARLAAVQKPAPPTAASAPDPAGSGTAPHPAGQPATHAARTPPGARTEAAAAPHRRRRRPTHRRAHPRADAKRAHATQHRLPAPAASSAVQVLGPAPGAAPHPAGDPAPVATTLRAGTRLAARLDAGADSTGRGPTSVRLVRSVIRGGRVLLPRGTRLLGHAAAAGDRLAVHFTRVVLPGGDARPLSGTALGADGRAGLLVPDAVTETGGHPVLALPAGTGVTVRLDAPLRVPAAAP